MFCLLFVQYFVWWAGSGPRTLIWSQKLWANNFLLKSVCQKTLERPLSTNKMVWRNCSFCDLSAITRTFWEGSQNSCERPENGNRARTWFVFNEICVQGKLLTMQIFCYPLDCATGTSPPSKSFSFWARLDVRPFAHTIQNIVCQKCVFVCCACSI